VKIKLILGASILLLSSNVNAFDVYTDRVSWEAAVSNINTEQFNTILDNNPVLVFDSGITSTSTNGLIANFVNDAFEFNGGVVDRVSDPDLVIEWTIPEPIYAFGADFKSIDSDGLKVLGNFDGAGEQTISIASELYTDTVPCVQCISGFFGIVGSASFDSIVWATDNSEETFQIDDFSYAAVAPVTIDIKPGSDPNPVNPRSNGVIPVAVMGSTDFDAMQVDFSTVTFGPDGATPAHDGHVEDVNDDGFMDAVFHFRTQETGIICGDTEATLNGETFDETRFTGTDTIKTVGCNGTSSLRAGAMSWMLLLGLSVLGLWRLNRR